MEEKRGRGRPRKEVASEGNVAAAAVEQETEEIGTVESPMPELRRKRILTVGERESIERSLSVHHQALAASPNGHILGTEGAAPVVPQGMRLNRSRLNLQAQDMARALEDGRPPEVDAKQRDALYKRARYLKNKFEHDQILETREELHVLKRDDKRWFTATEKAKLRPKYEDDITEYRNIMRTLDPQNPDADSLNVLRRDRD